MTQPFRTAAGGRIDRDQTLRFTFDGRRYEGFAGDTLAYNYFADTGYDWSPWACKP